MADYTPKELVTALRYCGHHDCKPCPMYGRGLYACLLPMLGAVAIIEKLEAENAALQAAMDRLGEFGQLLLDRNGCPRGPMGRMAGVSLVDEALAMPEISDVDGGRWIPVQADVLRELCELAKPRWISVNEQLPKAFEPVIVCREGTERGSVKVEQGCLDVNGWWKVYGTRTKHVTHWMPLPEPPAPEE